MSISSGQSLNCHAVTMNSRGQAGVCWSDTGTGAQFQGRHAGVRPFGLFQGNLCAGNTFPVGREAADPIHTHTEHRKRGPAWRLSLSRAWETQVWHYVIADGRDTQRWCTAGRTEWHCSTGVCNTSACRVHSHTLPRKQWKQFSVNICSQCKLIMGCLQKMSTKGHAHERKAFILMNSLNRINFYSRALSGGGRPECFWALTLCHGSSWQHTDVEGLDGVCTDSPQPRAPSAMGCSHTAHMQETHRCLCPAAPLGCKTRSVTAGALLLPLMHDIRQNVMAGAHGGIPASPSTQNHHCFSQRTIWCFISLWFPSLSTRCEPFPKDKYLLLIISPQMPQLRADVKVNIIFNSTAQICRFTGYSKVEGTTKIADSNS